MTIAIVAALHQELSTLLADTRADWQPLEHAGRAFWRGHCHGHEVVAGLSRVGKVAAATTAAALIERFGATRIVFTGVAGGLGADVAVGDMVVAEAFVQHDMDASPLFPRHEVPLYGRSRFATDAALRAQLRAAAQDVAEAVGREVRPEVEQGIAQDAAEQATARAAPRVDLAELRRLGVHAPRVHVGLVASGDRFVATSGESQALRRALPDALAVEMEGAAFAQVCADYGVPFAAVRTISDRADDDAHVDFVRFVEGVASHYSAAVIEAWLKACGR